MSRRADAADAEGDLSLGLLPSKSASSSASSSSSSAAAAASPPAPAHGDGFSLPVAVAFTVNYIMGCGFLGIPSAFVASGVALGPAVVVLFGLLMNASKDFVLEALGRAEALARMPRRVDEALRDAKAAAGAAPGGGGGGGGAREAAARALAAGPREEDYLVSSRGTFELTDLFFVFFGRAARTAYMAVLSMYLYGGLWAYSVVFAASFAANVPVTFLNGGRTCNVEEDGSACAGNFFVWLGVFALLAVPLSCLELKEQVYVQVLMFCARILVVLLMAGTVLAGYGCGRGGGTVFADMGPGEPAAAGSGAAGAAPLLRLAGLSHVMPVSIYAFIFHHSVPVLSQPVADKRSLRTVFLVAFLIVGAAYAGLGVVLAGWFGEHVDAQCNLNWRQYVGCAAPHADGSPVTLGDRSGAAAAVSFVVLIFPALDVLSAFPLNAVTLGNNLMSACYGAAAGAGADADGAGSGDAAAGDGDGGSGPAKAAKGAGGDAARRRPGAASFSGSSPPCHPSLPARSARTIT